MDHDRDRAGARELDGVCDEIEENLPQAPAVSASLLGHLIVDLQIELETFCLSLQPGDGTQALDHLPQGEVGHLHLHLTGFDL